MDEPDWLDERRLRTWENFLAVGTILNRQIAAGIDALLAKLKTAVGQDMR